MLLSLSLSKKKNKIRRTVNWGGRGGGEEVDSSSSSSGRRRAHTGVNEKGFFFFLLILFSTRPFFCSLIKVNPSE
jgi:hypothetical protein